MLVLIDQTGAPTSTDLGRQESSGDGNLMGLSYSFRSELFQTETEAAWVFVRVPADAADEIADTTTRRPGFGSIRVAARIGSTEWQTSLFPSREFGTYLLPVKQSVREREQISRGETTDVWIRLAE